MISRPIQISHEERFAEWLPEFLKKELAPYPGRGALVARVVISATLTMILIVTFRIPGGVAGVVSAFFLSRENLMSTARSAILIVVPFLIGTLFIPVGARFMASPPETHFVWVGVSLFVVFFLLRCLANYAIALGLALVFSNVVGIWYLPGPPERNVELTLWLLAAAVIGALVTLCVEVIFYALHGCDVLVQGLDTRLALIEDLMASYADGCPVCQATQAGLEQFAIVGSGVLRRHLAHASYTQSYRTRMSTMVSLVGRSLDFGAALAKAHPSLQLEGQERAAALRQSIADVRHCLSTQDEACKASIQARPNPGTPLLSELETMVSFMVSVFSQENAVDPALEPLDDTRGTNRIFIPDAFSNPEHLRYVLGGATAAMVCYIVYVSLDWRNLSTSVTTCVLTALTTIGSSRQKQTLRLAGFLLGGVVAGLGAQVFVLPYIDTIGGFTILFATMTAVSAWIATSSPRLSYTGMQFAFAFYLIHLSEFSMQTNLTIARDRALGVLFGITVMWLVFERLFPSSAASEMVRIFVINLRLLADLVSSSLRSDDRTAILKTQRQRDEIYRRFGEVNAQADAVPFETGPRRASEMAARDRIRRWQASLRTFYLLEAPLLQFQRFGAHGSKSASFTEFDNDFRCECSRIFLCIADSLENQLANRFHIAHPVESLFARIDSLPAKLEAEFSEREYALMRLMRTIAQLVDRLQGETSSEGLYEMPDAPEP